MNGNIEKFDSKLDVNNEQVIKKSVMFKPLNIIYILNYYLSIKLDNMVFNPNIVYTNDNCKNESTSLVLESNNTDFRYVVYNEDGVIDVKELKDREFTYKFLLDLYGINKEIIDKDKIKDLHFDNEIEDIICYLFEKQLKAKDNSLNIVDMFYIFNDYLNVSNNKIKIKKLNN